MKKVMLVAVMSLGTMAAFAQEEVQEVTTETTTVEAIAPEADQATEAVAAEATEAVMASEEAVEATEVAAVAQDSFIEVAVEEVPVSITDALAKDYPEAKVSKALKNDMEQYKLEVVAQDGSELVLFADSEGNWIEM